ncbi:Uncharacterised protein [Yersinia mollaretii]|uniref:hypothetical protein n=1 Tax=Yersinia mollaretii TaxID=33060 RepID=UPI0005E96023|nr:Uncharacterised protein [Yersinia mollaretii]
MAEKDGGMAFPVPATDSNYFYEGMSLRDYFAAKALTGMISTAGGPCLGGFDGYESHMASAAYVMADAMIKARG